MLPRDGPQLTDTRRTSEDHQEHPADGGQEQGHAEREMPVRAEVRDIHRLAVLQDEDQQEQQDHGEANHGDPQSADPGVPDGVMGQLRGRLLRSRLLSAGLGGSGLGGSGLGGSGLGGSGTRRWLWLGVLGVGSRCLG
jgi:hypothetical protein